MPTSKPSFAAISLLLPAVFLLVSCTESAPVSPSVDAAEGTLAPLSSGRVDIEIDNNARLRRINGQQFVAMSVWGICPRGYVITEEPLSLTQGELAFGDGGYAFPCTGRWEQSSFRVFSMGTVEFRRGNAKASVTLVVENTTTGEQLRGTDRERVVLR